MIKVTESRSGPFFEAHASHDGSVRDHNEDAYLARGGEGLWVVADGMGGLDDGQWASRVLARQLAEAPLSDDLERDAASVAEVVSHANFVIFRESTERQNHMGQRCPHEHRNAADNSCDQNAHVIPPTFAASKTLF